MLAQELPRAVFTQPSESSITVPEGHLALRWEVRGPQSDGDWEFDLEQSFNETFSPAYSVYTGIDRGTFVSGLPGDGAYFRIRARSATGDESEWGPWSETLRVAVAYPPMWQVAALGAAGLLMLGTLLGAIYVGSRRSRSHTAPES